MREVSVHVSSLLYFIYIFACYVNFSSFHLNFPLFLLFVRKINTCTDPLLKRVFYVKWYQRREKVSVLMNDINKFMKI